MALVFDLHICQRGLGQNHQRHSQSARNRNAKASQDRSFHINTYKLCLQVDHSFQFIIRSFRS
jgi:hypothetical protein